VIEALQRAAAQGGVDILVIDPIRNVFDGGPEGNSENDNNAMLFFLRERVEPSSIHLPWLLSTHFAGKPGPFRSSKTSVRSVRVSSGRYNNIPVV
jgi:hypothetical protein